MEKRIWRHGHKSGSTWRGWITYNIKRDTRRQIETKLEVSWSKYHHNLGFRFHVGDRGSETPIDIMLGFYWIAFYFSFNAPGLGRFCEWIGRGHKRDLALRIFGGSLWWDLWYDDDGGYDHYHCCDKWRRPLLPPWRWGRPKYRSWMCLRKGSIDLNPLDALFGTRKYSYTETDLKGHVLVEIGQFEDDRYLVEFTVCQEFLGRSYGPKFLRGIRDRGYIANWKCEDGIPFRNHEWKGDCTYSSAVKVDDSYLWPHQATNALIKEIRKMRQDYDYRPPSKTSD